MVLMKQQIVQTGALLSMNLHVIRFKAEYTSRGTNVSASDTNPTMPDSKYQLPHAGGKIIDHLERVYSFIPASQFSKLFSVYSCGIHSVELVPVKGTNTTN